MFTIVFFMLDKDDDIIEQILGFENYKTKCQSKQ